MQANKYLERNRNSTRSDFAQAVGSVGFSRLCGSKTRGQTTVRGPEKAQRSDCGQSHAGCGRCPQRREYVQEKAVPAAGQMRPGPPVMANMDATVYGKDMGRFRRGHL